jgi:hypothetical protein
MEWRAKVELFEAIRREYEFGMGAYEEWRGSWECIGGRCVKPWPMHNRRRGSSPSGAAVLAGLMPFIEAILSSDRQAPRKQRHTAHRIWQRIRAARPQQVVAESTIRKYVRERKRELGWSTRTTCVPQSYAPGQEGQVDWYEA